MVQVNNITSGDQNHVDNNITITDDATVTLSDSATGVAINSGDQANLDVTMNNSQDNTVIYNGSGDVNMQATMTGGAGNDSVEITSEGEHTVDLGGGDNTADITAKTANYTGGTGADDVTVNTTGDATVTAGSGDNVADITAENATYTGTSGNDDVTVNATDNADVTVGSGDNTVDVTATTATVAAGGGNDDITVNTTGAAAVSAGAGDNTANITAGSANYTGGAGVDNVTVNAEQDAAVTLGNGDNVADITAKTASVTAGGGNDNVTVATSEDATVNLGGGDNTADITADTVSFTSGGGVDNVTVAANGGTVETGAGADVIDASNSANVTINAGTGNDQIILGDNAMRVSFGSSDGVDSIDGFDPAVHQLVFENGTFTSVDDAIAAITYSSPNTETGLVSATITTSSGNTITINDIELNSIDPSNILIEGVNLNVVNSNASITNGEVHNEIEASANGTDVTFTAQNTNESLNYNGFEGANNSFTYTNNGGAVDDSNMNSVINGTSADDTVNIESAGNHQVDLKDGSNSFTVTSANDISYKGGADADNIDITATGNVTVDAGNGVNTATINANTAEYTGGSDVDTVNVTADAANISTGAGDDVISSLAATSGTINAGQGNDTINLQTGDNSTLLFGQSHGVDTVNGFDPDANSLTFDPSLFATPQDALDSISYLPNSGDSLYTALIETPNGVIEITDVEYGSISADNITISEVQVEQPDGGVGNPEDGGDTNSPEVQNSTDETPVLGTDAAVGVASGGVLAVMLGALNYLHLRSGFQDKVASKVKQNATIDEMIQDKGHFVEAAKNSWTISGVVTGALVGVGVTLGTLALPTAAVAGAAVGIGFASAAVGGALFRGAAALSASSFADQAIATKVALTPRYDGSGAPHVAQNQNEYSHEHQPQKSFAERFEKTNQHGSFAERVGQKQELDTLKRGDDFAEMVEESRQHSMQQAV